jgi:hypothetical protein
LKNPLTNVRWLARRLHVAGLLFGAGFGAALLAGERVKELRAIVHERDVTLALLTVANGRPTWIKVGQKLGENVLVSADPATEVAVMRDEKGESYSLTMIRAMVNEEASPAKMQPPPNFVPDPRLANFKPPPYIVYESYPEPGTRRSNEGLDWEFILSDRNELRNPYPFFKSYMGPNAVVDWLLLGSEQKAALVEKLRQHGWHMQITASSHGLGISAQRIGRSDPTETYFPPVANKATPSKQRADSSVP